VNIEYYVRISLDSDVIPKKFSVVEKGGNARRLLLADVEMWTHNCLSAWEATNIDRASACSDVANLIKDYVSEASATYEGDPEAISLMYLTVLDLWVCLDKMATKHEPILLDYEPGFPPALFEPLLLPRKCQMERLLAVEKHIVSRKTRSNPACSSVFSSFSAKNSIAVRYFKQSPMHQKLYADIERDAFVVREKKKQELIRKEEEQANLEAKAAATEHTMQSHWKYNKHTHVSEETTRHAGSCQKCAWTNQAASLTIDVHEWPLPSDSLQAKATVFELKCPATISIWRDCTYYILVDVFTTTSAKQAAGSGKSRELYQLQRYDGLQSYYASISNRLEIASVPKPIATSHYRSKTVSGATKFNICVEHALRYDIYDSMTSTLAVEFLGYCGIRENCSQQLPQGPYRSLQTFVTDTKHTPNEVIADQSICPPEVSIHEFFAFGHLRTGHRLQWQNIALALVDGNLRFNQEATRILITQAAWETGPSSLGNNDVLRESHTVLEDASFSMDIVESLHSAMAATEENWQGATSVRTFIALALRILTVSPHIKVRKQCLRVLAAARQATLSWMRKLAEKLRSCDEDHQRESWRSSALEVALSCSTTFDVDLSDMRELLTTGNSVAVFIECAVTIYDLCPASRSGLPKQIRQSLFGFSRMTHAMETTLHDILIQDSSGLDQTLRQLWTAYRPGSPWRATKEGEKEWLMTETFENEVPKSAVVHFNLLSGSLLVNGSPLSRLPRSYETHTSYQRLFGAVSPLPFLDRISLLISTTESADCSTINNGRHVL
jgi:hypothetical protein